MAESAERSNAQSLHEAAPKVAFEDRVRSAKSETELVHLLANDVRRSVSARQVVVVRLRKPRRPEVRCVSSLVLGDKDTPFVRWLEEMVRNILSQCGERDGATFQLPAYVEATAPETKGYPFTHIVWQPLHLVTGELFAGIIVARERPWSEPERKIIQREANSAAAAWQALHGAKSLLPRSRLGKRGRLVILLTASLCSILPVPMTTLAPVEIVGANPLRVTAPLDAVIQAILLEPNRAVSAGQTLLLFDSTTLRNRLQIAEQEVLVARSRFERASQAAFADEKARHDLALARADLNLKRTERTYAAELLSRTAVAADRSGLLVYSDKDRWIGRPVKTGERIMEIVDPSSIVARIELPVADAIVLAQGARVRLFLDASPLSAVTARLTSEGYHAVVNSAQQLVFRLHAEVDPDVDGLRIGARGTAQLQGQSVPLAFYLLRRPISSARQYIGL